MPEKFVPEGFSQKENENVRKVYGNLINTKFDFLNKPMSLQDIYDYVKMEWPQHCNDGYLCLQNCKSGGPSPEWKHQVRSAINDFKRKGMLQSDANKKYSRIEP